jgi:hypothetical protein
MDLDRVFFQQYVVVIFDLEVIISFRLIEASDLAAFLEPFQEVRFILWVLVFLLLLLLLFLQGLLLLLLSVFVDKRFNDFVD